MPPCIRYSVTATPSTPAAPAAPAVPLRIMSLGASVTFGIGSTTGDSYRKDLQDLLVAQGMNVTYVGTKSNGDFADNAVEATPGFKIDQIAAAADAAVPQLQPNLVLVDAGTNNCNKGGTVPDAGANVTAMINNIFAQSPGSTVILTSILANKIAKQDACRVDINTQYAALATQFQQAGAKFALVDMRSSIAPTLNDLNDTRHPNDGGYVKMANVWAQGIQEVVSKGFITAPN
ncbi:GDSL-like Lipase/Acylhydrolase [Colletotrichum eremochloae]|nr:GDSL-like Lipase/Acylhydrolase [Colletotrichum eremochloae]